MSENETKRTNTDLLQEQNAYAAHAAALLAARFPTRPPQVFVKTFGCQQNEADSERLLGQALAMGYTCAASQDDADLVIYNTCAVREHAELKALSLTGTLKHLKERNPGLIVGLWGCMVTQDHRVRDVKMKYPYVDFVAGTNMLHRLPEILCDVMETKRRRYYVSDEQPPIAEGVPVKRKSDIEAYVSIMYGCNNFCTYCVVPYVRGRERSREKDAVVAEVKGLVESGCREITLLGQNVNSYASGGVGFPALLREICALDGDFTVRFMTSHPKDASDELIELLANEPKMAKHFHLPMQSGSTEILKRMNRKYTAEEYIRLAERIKEKVPGVSLTTDIIVGFPGETDEDFQMTCDAVKRLRFDSAFAFIYSPRVGTPAASFADETPRKVKTERMAELIALQTGISAEINETFVGKTVPVFCRGEAEDAAGAGMLSGRTCGSKNVFFTFAGKDSLLSLRGKTVDVTVDRATPAYLYGSAVQPNK